MKILQLCFRVPFPPHDGGAIAMFNITKGLKDAGHEVHVLAFNTPKHFQESNVLDGIATLRTVYVDTSISVFDAFFNLFKSTPYNIERFISPEFEKALIELLRDNKYDVVHFEGMYVAVYIDVVRKYFQGPTVLRTHNLEYLIWKRLASNEKNYFKKWYLTNLASKLQKFENNYFARFTSIAAISRQDAVEIAKQIPDVNVAVVEPGIAIPEESISVASQKTIFILSAMEWQPNVEGIWWFLKNVWPEVHKALPKLELHIAGKRPPVELMELSMPNVIVHGFVPDALDFMRKNGLMLVPLWSGSGTRIKILEGMAASRPILATSIGAEGMEYISEENILVADTGDAWVSIISDYYYSPEKYERIGENAFTWVKENYTNEKSVQKLLNLYKQSL